MKLLLLLRHAEATSLDSSPLDHDRPLTERGRRAAALIGSLIKAEQAMFDVVLSSTALRATTTADEVARACGFSGPIHLDRRLYLAGARALLMLLRELMDAAGSALVVGHNPGIEALVEELSGWRERMPTAGLAILKAPIHHWCELELDRTAELVGLFRAE